MFINVYRRLVYWRAGCCCKMGYLAFAQFGYRGVRRDGSLLLSAYSVFYTYNLSVISKDFITLENQTKCVKNQSDKTWGVSVGDSLHLTCLRQEISKQNEIEGGVGSERASTSSKAATKVDSIFTGPHSPFSYHPRYDVDVQRGRWSAHENDETSIEAPRPALIHPAPCV